jgi:hypothetical protein
MSKVSKLAVVAVTLPVLAFSAPVFASSAGTLGGGDNYVAKNLTHSSSYGDSTTATCGDTVQYSMMLTNTQYGSVTVNLNATLPSQGGVSTATATTNLGGNTGTTDTTTVTLSSGATQSYVNGSTKLYDSNGQLIGSLPDGVITSGVNVGTLAGSTTEVVNFQAKVNCKEQPKQIQVCELSTKKVITINEDQFDSSKHSKDLTKCQTPPTTPPVTPPTTLVNTGAGSVAGVAAAIAAVSAVAYNVVLRRRAARQ